MENLLFLGVPILKHIRVVLTDHFFEFCRCNFYECIGRAIALPLASALALESVLAAAALV